MKLAAKDIIEGTDVTSEKIRRLAKHGYDRTEIAKFLGIRYQHVRNVLIQSGIDGGLKKPRNQSIKSISVSSSKPKHPTSGDKLGKIGFKIVGNWMRTEDGGILLDSKAPDGYGVYAILCDDRVVYIGVSKAVRRRMENYRVGHARQKTSARIKDLIGRAIADGCIITVMAIIPGTVDWQGLSIHVAPGLEIALIEKIRPEWNLLGLA
jgi:hypothetical protein